MQLFCSCRIRNRIQWNAAITARRDLDEKIDWKPLSTSLASSSSSPSSPSLVVSHNNGKSETQFLIVTICLVRVCVSTQKNNFAKLTCIIGFFLKRASLGRPILHHKKWACRGLFLLNRIGYPRPLFLFSLEV